MAIISRRRLKPLAQLHMKLPAYESEASAEFQKKTFKLAKKIRLRFPLVKRFFESQEVEDVRVLESLLH